MVSWIFRQNKSEKFWVLKYTRQTALKVATIFWRFKLKKTDDKNIYQSKLYKLDSIVDLVVTYKYYLC